MSYMVSDRHEWLDEMYNLGVVDEILKLMRDEPDEYARHRSLDPIGPGNKGGMTRIMHSSILLLRKLARDNSTRRDGILRAGSVEAIATMLHSVGDLVHNGVMRSDFDPLMQSCGFLDDLLRDGPEAD